MVKIESIRDEGFDNWVKGLPSSIYWTSLACALWKIVHLTVEIKKRVLEIIDAGASPLWGEYINEKAKQSRQKRLDKLALQLESENLKPIKPYKPRIFISKSQGNREFGDFI